MLDDAVFNQATTQIGRSGWEIMYDADWDSRLHTGTIFGIVFGLARAQYGSQRYSPAAPDQCLTAAGQACESSNLEFPWVEECKREHTYGVRR